MQTPATQWLNYVAELYHNLTRPALIVPVMDELTMQGPPTSFSKYQSRLTA